MPSGSQSHQNGFSPFSPFGWEPFAIHKLYPMALNPRGIWRQAQLIWGLQHCRQDLLSLPPGSARLLLNPFLCAHACVWGRRCACTRCVTCWSPGSEGRWGSHSHHVDWESRGTQGAVPRGKGKSWEKSSFSFYASLEFSISLPSSLRRAEEPLNLLHQQKPWNDTSQCRPYWGERGIFVHRWGHH